MSNETCFLLYLLRFLKFIVKVHIVNITVLQLRFTYGITGLAWLCVLVSHPLRRSNSSLAGITAVNIKVSGLEELIMTREYTRPSCSGYSARICFRTTLDQSTDFSTKLTIFTEARKILEMFKDNLYCKINFNLNIILQ